MSTYGQNQAKNNRAAANRFSEPDIASNIGNTADDAIIWVCESSQNPSNALAGLAAWWAYPQILPTL